MKTIKGISQQQFQNESRWVAKFTWGREVGTHAEVDSWIAAYPNDLRDVDLTCGQPEHLQAAFDEFQQLSKEHGWMTIPECWERFGEEVAA